MTEDIYQKAEEAAEFPPTVNKTDLLGQVFTIIRVTPKDTEYGPNWIATILWPPDSDEEQEFWGGVVLNRQFQAIQDDLPATWTLTRDSRKNSPFILRAPDGEPAPEAGVDSPQTVAAKATASQSSITRRANAAGTKQPDVEVVTVRRKNGEQVDMPWDEFLDAWKGEGFGEDELGTICGATTAQAVTHWFAADKGRTITVLKVEATKRRKPFEEKIPFE